MMEVKWEALARFGVIDPKEPSLVPRVVGDNHTKGSALLRVQQ